MGDGKSLTSLTSLTGRLAGVMRSEQSSGMSDRGGRFVNGGKPGPGRPVGARSKLGEQFLLDLATVWKQDGLDALRRCAADEPAQFVRVVASLMPREATLDINVDVHEQVLDLLAVFRDNLNGGKTDAALEKMARRLLPRIIHAEPEPE
jgi:hypothetical protein